MGTILMTILTFALLLSVRIEKSHIVMLVIVGVVINPGVIIGLILRLILNSKGDGL